MCNWKNYNPHKKPISLLNVSICTQGMQRTWWPEAGTIIVTGPYYANPVYGVATICHQVRWLRWGHPSLFHADTSLLIWYKMFCVRDISYRLIWMEFINMFSMYAQSGMHSRFNYCGFNIQPFCSDVYGDHRCPQTLAEMFRNMGICYSFRSVAARVKYPGFM